MFGRKAARSEGDQSGSEIIRPSDLTSKLGRQAFNMVMHPQPLPPDYRPHQLAPTPDASDDYPDLSYANQAGFSDGDEQELFRLACGNRLPDNAAE